MAAFAAEKGLIPAAAGLDVGNSDEGLGTHEQMIMGDLWFGQRRTLEQIQLNPSHIRRL